jgi:Arc/MetJ-type ribon-helix-helix transcriptional regulator
MTPTRVPVVCLVVIAALLASAGAQRRRDPLNQLEIDQLRDMSWDPEQRLKLYVKFARARLEALEQARTDPKVTDKSQEVHDRLQDFLDVYDELNENIDTYVDRKSDLRKALKPVIESDTEFQARLRAIKDAAETGRQETHTYEFLLTNTLETVDASAQEHRQLLRDEEEEWKHKKANKSSNRQN